MYKIIGTDGKEYGPISADLMRQWIAEGRVNAQTSILPEGATEWRPASEFPEFAAALAARAGTPVQPPVLGGTSEADALAAEILARDYFLNIGSCLGRGWDLVVSRFWFTVGAAFISFLLVTASSLVPFGSLLLAYVLWGGLHWMFLKMIRGQPVELGDIFAGFNLAFVPLMLFSLVSQLLLFAGFVLCILPGIYLAVVWMVFTDILIIDKKLEFWPAMELCRKVVNRHWWKVFGFLLVNLLLLFVGSLLCGVGFFIALPVVTAATVYAYEDIFGSQMPPEMLSMRPPESPSSTAAGPV